MSKDGYLPPGVEDGDLPGNTPEDVEWEKMLDAVGCEASDLIMRAEEVLLKSRHFRYDEDVLRDLVCDALGVERR